MKRYTVTYEDRPLDEATALEIARLCGYPTYDDAREIFEIVVTPRGATAKFRVEQDVEA